LLGIGFLALLVLSCSDTNNTTSFDPNELECSDGVDNDEDGFVDLVDPGCSGNPFSASEAGEPACSDGVDNDGDALIDMADFGCSNPDDAREYPNPRCSDGIDNDGDTFIDFPADPECASETDNREDI
jgi:hypothetical protein